MERNDFGGVGFCWVSVLLIILQVETSQMLSEKEILFTCCLSGDFIQHYYSGNEKNILLSCFIT